MAAFRLPLLLGLSTTVTLHAADSDDFKNIIELMNATYTSTVIMQSCPAATEVLLACCLLLGAAIGGMTYRIGVGSASKPSPASAAAGCCCCSCSLFFVLLFPPIFAFYMAQGSSCEATESHAAFVDSGVTERFIVVFLMLLTYFARNLVTTTCGGAIASFHAKAKSCCACCKEPNDGNTANMLVCLVALVGYLLVAGVALACFEQLGAPAQRGACLAEVLLAFCVYGSWWSRFYATPAVEGAEPLLVDATPA